jgi:hypothetical protein
MRGAYRSLGLRPGSFLCLAVQMASCYRCGRKLTSKKFQPRRKVKTGEWVRRGFARQNVQAVQNHFGMRIVCPRCARQIDLENKRIELTEMAKLILALAVLFVVLIFHALR